MRGKSYDNALNMKNRYKGLQSRIKGTSPCAEYTTCVAHWMKLIGTHAVECCHKAIEFFALSQKMYNFFTESIH